MLLDTDRAQGASGSGVRPGPGRPRVEALDARILAAAVEILDAGEDVTVSKVVDRSGVSRAALYRRWPSITGLIAAALDSGRTEYPTVDLDGDVRESLMRSLLPPAGGQHPSAQDYPHRRFLQRLKLMVDDRELQRAYWESHVSRRRDPLEASIAEAVRRGILRPDIDAAAAVDALASVLYYQIIVRGADLNDPETRARVSAAYEIVWRGMVASPRE